jgi:hypothetical protein
VKETINNFKNSVSNVLQSLQWFNNQQNNWKNKKKNNDLFFLTESKTNHVSWYNVRGIKWVFDGIVVFEEASLSWLYYST